MPLLAAAALSLAITASAVCPPADLTEDCFVDIADFVIVSRWWLSDCDTSNAFCGGADFDSSGQVTLDNLLNVAFLWLEGQRFGVSGMTWVSIDDPGVAGRDGFSGRISKFETTNAQYAQFLNAALETGDIVVDDNYVKGAVGSNHGMDYVDGRYYRLDGPGETFDGAEDGGKSRIFYSGGSFRVAAGFENHPVTYVSWYGAAAFADYYGWRLPTEWEWQAVADFDGSYNYGCGLIIDNSKANYRDSDHPYGTTAVGAFGAYGYGMADMAGNVWEWTSTISGNYRILRGGSWYYSDYSSRVSARLGLYPYYMYYDSGFRVCH